MTTTAIRKKLHDYIADASDNKIKGMYLLLEEDIAKTSEFILSPQHLEIVEAEKEKHLLGYSKSYSWEESKNIIKSKK